MIYIINYINDSGRSQSKYCFTSSEHRDGFDQEFEQIVEKPDSNGGQHTNGHDGLYQPGRAPSQVVKWGVEGIAKGGAMAIIGVYPQPMATSRSGRR